MIRFNSPVHHHESRRSYDFDKGVQIPEAVVVILQYRKFRMPSNKHALGCFIIGPIIMERESRIMLHVWDVFNPGIKYKARQAVAAA
jgi:hypothetical protein